MTDEKETKLRKYLPEIIALLLITFGAPAAVQFAPDKRTALIIIPIVCILYILMKWEAMRDGNTT